MKKSTSKSKSKLIIESKLGPLFVMTVGEWKEDKCEYKVRGKAYIPLTEIAGLTQTTFRGRLFSKVKLKTPIGLGINGIGTSFEIPAEEWNELFKYLTATDEEKK